MQMRIADVQWTIRDSTAAWAPNLVTPYLSRLTELPGTRLIKRNMMRTIVLAGPPSVPNEVVIKVHRCAHVLERLKHLFRPSKAAQEWKMAQVFAAAGVPTFKPVAYAERRRFGLLQECCLISEALPNAEPLISLLAGPLQAWSVTDRQRLFNDLAGVVRRMHGANITHHDLHAANVLCQPTEGGARWYVLDLHATRKVGRLTWGRRRRDWAPMVAWMLAHTSPQERHGMLKAYAQGDAAMEQFIAEQGQGIEADAEAHIEWVRRVRTVRCLKPSSEFDVQQIDGARVYFRRELPPERIRQAMRLHSEAVAAHDAQLLKVSTRGWITAVNIETDRTPLHLCVKVSKSYGWKERIEALFRGSESRRIWVAANGLRWRGVAACKLLAAGERRRFGFVTQTFVIMKALENCIPLDQYLHPRLSYLQGAKLAQFKAGLAQSMGRFLAMLHARQIFHADLKPSNIMVRERTEHDWEFILVDLDRVRFNRDVDLKRRARNLAQLDSAFQHRLTNADRLRCFRAYIKASPDIGDPGGFRKIVQRQSSRFQQYNLKILQRMVAELKLEHNSPPPPP